MRDKWIVIVAIVALGGVGYLYYKDKQESASASPSGGTVAAGGTLNVNTPQSLADTSIGSYVDPTGGMQYVDAVPISVTSPTGFTAQDYNYGVVNEAPIATANGFDLVQEPGQNGITTVVPKGISSLISYGSVV